MPERSQGCVSSGRGERMNAERMERFLEAMRKQACEHGHFFRDGKEKCECNLEIDEVLR